MILPEGRERLTKWALEIIARCNESTGTRATYGMKLKQWRYSGSEEGNKAIVNRLNHHVDRMASYLFSPSELKFHIDFSYYYPKEMLQKAEMASRVLTREFEIRDIDLQFAEGVDLALAYGACLTKITWEHDGLNCRLISPWQVGVYSEWLEDLGSQEAICETLYITPFDLWRRISHLPDAKAMFDRAVNHAKNRSSNDDSADSFFTQVVLAGSSPVVQTQAPFSSSPGGVFNISNSAGGAVISPVVSQEMIQFFELWVLDDETEDYTTIQIVAPDILITPLGRKRNLFVEKEIPYTLIQPNKIHGYLWGRSEMEDILMLQGLLKERMDDLRRLMSLQYDRMIAFIGQSGMNDEMYDQFRQAGWVAMDTGDVKDLTPEIPKEAFADIDHIIKFMDDVTGFSNIMSGQGEQGVRAGAHAQTLLKTASPRMRDRSIMVERQCADLGEKVLKLKAEKDPKAFWAEDGQEFLLSQLPDDRRVTVDSHSTSPIYQQDHKEIAAFLMKSGVINGESLLDLLPVPMKDILKTRFREQEAQKAAFIQQHPEALHGGGKKK